MSVAPNPFLDPNDGHNLSDDMEKHRELVEWRPGSAVQPNPFLIGINPVTGQPPYGIPFPALRPGVLAPGG
jgi:hypothetical protein